MIEERLATCWFLMELVKKMQPLLSMHSKDLLSQLMGTVLNWGHVEEKGRQIESLCRTKCEIEDNRVILYALFKFIEHCNLECNHEFHLSYLFDEETERDGISPVRMFGIYDEEEWKSILLGLSARYPNFIGATFTNDLKTISLKEKTAEDVLELFREDM